MYALTRSFVNRAPLMRQVQLMHISAATPASMRIVPVPAVDKSEGYENKNMRLKREMSPFLTIYKPQLTSVLSFTHRSTGFALSMYAWTLGLGALLLPHDSTTILTMIEGLELNDNLLLAAKYTLAWPFAYHALNGIRHLFWDTGRFLKLKEVYTTGYIMLSSSCVLAGILAYL